MAWARLSATTESVGSYVGRRQAGWGRRTANGRPALVEDVDRAQQLPKATALRICVHFARALAIPILAMPAIGTALSGSVVVRTKRALRRPARLSGGGRGIRTVGPPCEPVGLSGRNVHAHQAPRTVSELPGTTPPCPRRTGGSNPFAPPASRCFGPASGRGVGRRFVERARPAR